ncbi:MAG: OmpA family protein [Sedimenticola sp.]
MKKLLAVSALTGLVLVSPVGAVESGSDSLKEVEQQELQGMGAGALAGGVIAGPAGIVIGAIGGALVGRSNGLEEELGKAQQKLAQLEMELSLGERRHQELKMRLEDNESQLGGLDKALSKSRQQHSDQLNAITEGFVLAIHFRTGSAELEVGYGEQLGRLATALRRLPELDAHIDGYADIRGQGDLNLSLSKQRVEVVKRRLLAHGLGSSHLIERTYGESKARYAVEDFEGLGLDRRVVIHFCRRSGT